MEARVERGYPPHRPPHPVRPNGTPLLAAACYEHRHHMVSAERRSELLDMLFEQSIQRGVDLHAWAVLPNHCHLLADEPEFGVLGDLFRRAHGRTARNWDARDGAQGRKVRYSCTDRRMRSEGHYFDTLNYIHHNPVRHGRAAWPGLSRVVEADTACRLG